ncbi:protein insensitive [Stomoxys calcitrans]|uniref:BEN domain-containing protein n=1 Tax=Stomoxys calcitrans TaxID=35570 RepID=A0A1I8Q5E0_STOCA|nr:protein insensitive [Stomoxys calcitrans]
MEPKIVSSQILVKPQQRFPPKIISGSSQNFQSTPEPGERHERPLMVNAWTQTVGNDFTFLHELETKDQTSKRELELMEKVRVLEENLKAHTELLSQIHATSAMTSALLGQPQQLQVQIKPTVQLQTTKPHHDTQMNNKASNSNPQNRSNHNSPTSSVINPLHSTGSAPTESVKYTIIAEGTGDAHGEPIEIQLAEDDGALNLNSSADSGRLEICLAPEEVEIKTESVSMPSSSSTLSQSNSTASLASTEHNFIKRRKLETYQNEVRVDNANYYFNEQGVLTQTPNANGSGFNQQSQQKRRSNNSLLKEIRTENYKGSAQLSNTPSPLMNTSTINNGILNRGSMDNKIDTDLVMVSIGPNNTRIPAKTYEGMNWNSASIATRKLLMAIFDRKTLATHSMTGKPSPAFKDHGKPLKQMLDPMVIQDIIFAVTRKCNVSEKEVRNAITTKCADENKMMKLQMNKRTPMREINKENIVFKSES